MLTRELAIAAFEDGKIVPDRLSRKTHATYLCLAERMLDIYRTGKGRTRKELHHAVERVFAGQLDCPNRRVQAFCKLLDEVSQFHQGNPKEISELRISVFRSAAKHHPLVNQADVLFHAQESLVKRQIAAEHGMEWQELRAKLFSDLIEYHELETFDGYQDASALLARYNVAQTQAVLFDAVHLTVQASRDFKAILRFAKLAKLMHRITKLKESYRFDFDGPASVLNRTYRYGAAMAKFLPGLLSCSGWTMEATLHKPRWSSSIAFRLEDPCGLASGVSKVDKYDSSVEECFAKHWGDEAREGWRLERETEILHRGQTVFFPDFVFVHRSGLRILFEIIAFWTSDYLKYKSDVLHRFRDERILLAIADSVEGRWNACLDCPHLVFKKQIRVEEVLRQLKRYLESQRSPL